METPLYFLMIFGFYLIIVASVLVGVYSPTKIQLLTFHKYVQDVFDISVCFITNKNNIRYYFWTIIFSCFNIIAFAIFLWLWLSIWGRVFYIIGFIIVFLLSWVFIFLIPNKIIKQLKKFGTCSKQGAIDSFNNLSKKYYSSNLQKLNFQILKDKKLAARNRPFQFHQKRYIKKIAKILQKEISTNKKKEKILLIFYQYLKNYAIFIKSIAIETGQYSYLIDNENQSWNQLPTTLIHNFFAMIQENNHK